MAVIKFKQLQKEGVLSVTGSIVAISAQGSEIPALIVSGSQHIVPTQDHSGSIYIQGLGTFADTGSQAAIDLGEY